MNMLLSHQRLVPYHIWSDLQGLSPQCVRIPSHIYSMTFPPLPKPLILPRALPLPPQWLLWLRFFHSHALRSNNKLQKSNISLSCLKSYNVFFSTDPIKPKFMTMMNICFEQGLVSTGSPPTTQPKITLNFRSSCFSIGRRRLQVCTPIPPFSLPCAWDRTWLHEW